MKASIILIALLAIVLMVVVDGAPRGGNRGVQRFGRGGQNNNNQQQNNNNQQNNQQKNQQNNNNNNNNQQNNNSSSNNQQNNNNNNATAANSSTQTPAQNQLNNNICNGQTPTNGQQNKGGSCSNTVQGQIPNVNNMVSTLIVSPQNGQQLKANSPFNVSLITNNLDTGFFDNPDNQYYLFPQSLNAQGQIFGHQHVTIQQLDGNGPPDAQNFAFFKGLNDPAVNGLLTVAVTSANGNGLPAGNYRVCSLTGTFSHQPVIMPVAQRGAQDDCIRISCK